MNIKKKAKYIPLLLILIISIGFAYLTSTLLISGLIGYKGNKWNIYFDNVQVIINDVNANKPTINNLKDSVSFSVTFSEPGETLKFSVDVINEGTIDAMLNEVVKTGINSINQEYLSYTVKYYDDTELQLKDAIKAGSKTKLNVEVKYDYNTSIIATAGNQEFSISLKYVQATDNANFLSPMYETGANNVFTLSNTKSNSMGNFKIYGNSKQTQYSGQNLFNYRAGGLTADSEDWITSTCDNSSGSSVRYLNYYTPNLNVEVGKKYRMVLEVKNVSGNGTIVPVSVFNQEGQFSGSRTFSFSNLTNGSIIFDNTTALDQGNRGLRTFVSYGAGQSGSITFRISLIEDLNASEDNFVYEPYVGGEPSPNPDYPQEVKTVTGNSTLRIIGKNLLDYNNIVYRGNNSHLYVDDENYVYDTNSTSDGREWGYGQSQWHITLPKGTYTLSLRFKKQSTQGDNKGNIYNDKSNTLRTAFSIANKDFISISFTLNEKTNIGILIKSYDGVYRVQLEEGNTATEFEPYQERYYPINLGSLELNKISDYKDSIYYEDGDWYIEKNIGNYTFTGLETFYWEADIPRIYYFFNIIGIDNMFPSNTTDMPFIKCNKYIPTTINDLFFVSYANRKNNSITLSNNNVISFRRIKWTSEEAISDITGSKIYYVYKNPRKEKITDTTLVNQLNAIRSSNLFDGINHVYYDSDISTDISFDYIEE